MPIQIKLFSGLLILAFLLTFPLKLWSCCATDDLEQQLIKENPEISEKKEYYNEQALNFTSEHGDFNKGAQPDYIIPVVFHVIHDEGEGNISNGQIRSAMTQLNEDFRLENEDADNIISEFEDIAADTRVEFRLATKDPDGNSTNGINRINSELTNNPGPGGSAIMDMALWDYQSYLNIYVVNEIPAGGGGTVLGFATLPWMASSSRDGIFIRHDYLGNTGTAQGNTNRTFTHELGHYLGLLHTFQSDGCPSEGSDCSSEKDQVCDTPFSESAHFGCNTARETCGSLDNIQNHMDYSDCRVMFTEGQRDRMEFFLNNSSSRYPLHTQQNLDETGAGIPISDFEVMDRIICVDKEINFESRALNMYGDNLDYSWTITGEETINSTQQNPSVIFSEPGQYDVELIVSNEKGSDTIKKENFLFVSAQASEINAHYEERFNSPDFWEEGWRQLSTISNIQWEHTDEAGVSGNGALFLNNFVSSSQSETHSVIVPGINIEGLENPEIKFDYAYNLSASNSNDRLSVRVSTNCGDVWRTVEQITARDLQTASEFSDEAFYPDEDEWVNLTVSIEDFVDAENIWVQLRFISGIGGNNIFIDNFMVTDPVFASNQDMQQKEDLTVFPNPFSDEITLRTGDFSGEAELNIISLTGKEMYSGNITATGNRSETTFKASELNIEENGWYIMQVTTKEKQTIKRIGYFAR